MFARAIAKTAAKRVARVAAKPMLRFAPVAAYSSTTLSMKKAQQEKLSLQDLIRREYEYEEANGGDIDGEYEDVKKIVQKSFQIHEEPGKGEVRLTRTHGDETIEVSFHVQDVEEEMQYEEEETQEEGPGIGVNFRVDITSGDKKMSIVAVGGQELDVRGIRFLPANADRKNEEVFYGGPDFADLEEDVQEAFLDYLEERKIDGDLAFFVLSHSREKEQKEYINWLDEFENFIHKN